MNNFPEHNDYSGLHLFNETNGSLPVNKDDVSHIMRIISRHETCGYSLIEIVFVDENEIMQINIEHLNHDYVTDIITFHYSDEKDLKNIEGTLYCCFPQIKRQAKKHNQPLRKEFLRIVIHGLLHLCGYNDQTDTDQQQMTERENFYLSKLSLS